MMKTSGETSKGKGRIRSLNRKGSRSGKVPAVAARTGTPQDGTVCERCGAVFSRRTWRRGRKLTETQLGAATWALCPACEQVNEGEYFGRVIIRGAYAEANEAVIRRRIKNVAGRAEFTQPERRIVSINRENATLEILTTSQKLAHRIVHELKKAFGGKSSYAWSDSDGTLSATWQRHDVSTVKRAAR
ncbi:MAG: NMD3-related protein [Candidatus Binatia bacterium]